MVLQGGIEGTFLAAAGSDKKMDLGEFTRACASMGMVLDVAEALAAFDAIDIDHNDFVSFEEFQKFAQEVCLLARYNGHIVWSSEQNRSFSKLH